MIYVMGGGGGKLFAAIGVTYPAGSTCTCTKGSKVLKAKDTSGKFIFNVPEAGSWVVACTNGSQSKERTVSITEQSQVENVTLTYGLVLFEAGQLGVITGFTQGDNGGGGYVSWNTDGDTLKFNINPYSGGSVQGWFKSTPDIDFTGYSRLELDLQYKNTPAETGMNKVEIISNGTVAASVVVPDTTRKTVTIDISNINQTASVRFQIRSHDRSTGNTLTAWSAIAHE